MKDQRYISVPEAARLLNITRQAAWALVRSGLLGAKLLPVRRRNRIFVYRQSVVALLANPEYAKITRRKDREEFARKMAAKREE